MKISSLILLLILITGFGGGCAKTSASMYDPATGNMVFKVSTLTVQKDIKEAHLDTTGDGVKFDLGSSTGSMTPEMACALGYKPACGP